MTAQATLPSPTPSPAEITPRRLTRTERRILQLLQAQPGQPLKRSDLVAKVMNGAVVTERTIDVHIRSLRVKLGPAAAECIQTVRGVGYRWYEEGNAAATLV